jgi:PKHD-type hydroxylase
MLLQLTHILSKEELTAAQTLLGDEAAWIPGTTSAGGQALTQKNNLQLAQDSEAATRLRALVLAAVQRDPIFFSATLPKKIFNPLFNRYGGEANHYGSHVDGAVLHSKATGQWVRTDISCTLFLADPDSYDGGELVVQDTFGTRSVKLPAGDMVVYPGTSVHRVEPVTRGVRLASFFWIESMVRSDEQRRLLHDMDMSLLRLRQQHGETPEATALTGTYHNLLRMWADT